MQVINLCPMAKQPIFTTEVEYGIGKNINRNMVEFFSEKRYGFIKTSILITDKGLIFKKQAIINLDDEYSSCSTNKQVFLVDNLVFNNSNEQYFMMILNNAYYTNKLPTDSNCLSVDDNYVYLMSSNIPIKVPIDVFKLDEDYYDHIRTEFDSKYNNVEFTGMYHSKGEAFIVRLHYKKLTITNFDTTRIIYHCKKFVEPGECIKSMNHDESYIYFAIKNGAINYVRMLSIKTFNTICQIMLPATHIHILITPTEDYLMLRTNRKTEYIFDYFLFKKNNERVGFLSCLF